MRNKRYESKSSGQRDIKVLLASLFRSNQVFKSLGHFSRHNNITFLDIPQKVFAFNDVSKAEFQADESTSLVSRAQSTIDNEQRLTMDSFRPKHSFRLGSNQSQREAKRIESYHCWVRTPLVPIPWLHMPRMEVQWPVHHARLPRW